MKLSGYRNSPVNLCSESCVFVKLLSSSTSTKLRETCCLPRVVLFANAMASLEIRSDPLAGITWWSDADTTTKTSSTKSPEGNITPLCLVTSYTAPRPFRAWFIDIEERPTWVAIF
nr:hypothetical protein CFP56_07478 [Quercus suber]